LFFFTDSHCIDAENDYALKCQLKGQEKEDRKRNHIYAAKMTKASQNKEKKNFALDYLVN